MEAVDDIHSLYTFDKLVHETKFGKVYLGQEMTDMIPVIIKQSSK